MMMTAVTLLALIGLVGCAPAVTEPGHKKGMSVYRRADEECRDRAFWTLLWSPAGGYERCMAARGYAVTADGPERGIQR